MTTIPATPAKTEKQFADAFEGRISAVLRRWPNLMRNATPRPDVPGQMLLDEIDVPVEVTIERRVLQESPR